MSGDYKELIAWQKSMDVVEHIYRLTACFPHGELYGLTNQLRRAAVSVPSNIAEGHGRWTDAEFVRGLKVANGSRQEIETQVLIAARLGLVTDVQINALLHELDEVGRIIFGLIRSKTTDQ